MVRLVNRVKHAVSGTPGTGTVSLGSAASGFQTASAAGLNDGDTVSYVIEDGTNWECGVGTYLSASTGSIERTIPLQSSSGATTLISATSSATIYLDALANDLTPDPLALTAYAAFNGTVDSSGNVALTSSHNCTITRVATGKYNIAFATPVPATVIPLGAGGFNSYTNDDGISCSWGRNSSDSPPDDVTWINAITMQCRSTISGSLYDPMNIRFLMVGIPNDEPATIVGAQGYSHYRLELTDMKNGRTGQFQIAEVVFKDTSGTTKTVSTVTTDNDSASTVGNIIDGNTATNYSSLTPSSPCNLNFTFAAAFQLGSLAITAGSASANGTLAPDRFNLYGSNDGSTWIPLQRCVLPAWSDGQTQTITLPNPLVSINDTTNAYSCYRFQFRSNSAGTDFYEVYNLKVYDKYGSLQQPTSATCDNNRNSGFFDPNCAVGLRTDQTPPEYQSTSGTGAVANFDVFFASAFVFNALQLQAGNEATNCPLTVGVYGSYDGLAFTHLVDLTFPSAWTTYQQQQLVNAFGGTTAAGTSANPNAGPPATIPPATSGTGRARNGVYLLPADLRALISVYNGNV